MAGLEEIFLLCEEEGVKTRVMLSFFPHVTSKVYLEALQDLPLLTFTTTPQNDYLLLVKNGIDLVPGLRAPDVDGASVGLDRALGQDHLERADSLQTDPLRVGRAGVCLLQVPVHGRKRRSHPEPSATSQ